MHPIISKSRYHKLQRKLQDTRVRGSVIALDTCILCYRHDLAEAGSAQIRLEIETPKRIRYVECLGTKFHSLLFADPEGSRERQVELESSGTLDRVFPHVSVTT